MFINLQLSPEFPSSHPTRMDIRPFSVQNLSIDQLGGQMSDAKTKIFLDLPAEIHELLDTNGINIEEELARDPLVRSISYEAIPDSSQARSKDVVMVILASGATALSIGFAISQILNTIFKRPHKVDYFDLVEVPGDGTKGNGMVKIERVLRHEILSPRPENSKITGEISLGLSKGIVVKFSSTSSQGAIEKPDPKCKV